jgi:Ca2+-transporting ATPase
VQVDSLARSESNMAQRTLISGLSEAEAEARLARFGPNELPSPRPDGLAKRVLRQLWEPLSLLLVVAAAISGFGLREPENAVAILAIVVLNVVIGVLEEGKAARALEALRSLETPHARVLRGGAVAVIPSREVVPGDVVLLAAGDRVPADLRLSRDASLQVDESLLTGESLPVTKRASRDGDAPEAVAFSGTLVTTGSGEGVVTATGPATQLGAIASQLGGREAATPMQRELARLTARLGAIAVAIAVVVFGLTLLRLGTSGSGFQRAFLSSVALAVAAVPEGLATVVAVALAMGVRRMAARGAIVRRLPAVETLGSTTVILTDKTGTITQNRLRLEAVAVPGEGWKLPAELEPAAAMRVAEVAVLCNDAEGEPPSGDPLDVALLKGFDANVVRELLGTRPRVGEIPFDSDRKRMVTLHRTDEGVLLLVKGAPEVVLDRCEFAIGGDGRRGTLTTADRDAIASMVQEEAGRGVRVLALARRPLDRSPASIEEIETGLELVGLAGLRDPSRAEAPAAVADARSAGIEVVMVTGDHAGTAAAIAEEVGLAEPGGRVLTGRDLRDSGIPDDPLAVRLYARTSPADKLALVESLQSAGHVVAVTGDGVNDAPALRRADIGVAMGRDGSDVAREAADMVVTDDNLATIVTAVREGRAIYDNIRKVVDYLVAGNLSEITVVVAGLLFFPALGVPLLPLQLLWINLLTDGPPAVALGMDAADPAIMSRPPRRRGEGLLGARHAGMLYLRGLLIASATIGSLVLARFAWDEPWPHARALMFTVLVAAHLTYAYAVRRPGTRGNPWLLASVAGGIALQVLIVSWTPAHSLFGTVSLSLRDWTAALVLGALPVVVLMVAARRRPASRGRLEEDRAAVRHEGAR